MARRSIRWLLILVSIILPIVTLSYYGVELLDLGLFAATIFFCTLIPGLLLLSFSHTSQDGAYRFALATVTGICLDIILYILLSILQLKSMFYPLFGMLFLAYIIRGNLREDLRTVIGAAATLETRYVAALSLSSLLLLALIGIFHFIPNPLPGGSSPLIYYIDQPWHLANIAEISNHWYPQDARLAGYPFHYHIFVYVFIAIIGNISGISLPVLFFRLVPFFLLYLLFGGAYFSGSRWFNRRSIGVLHISTFFFLGTALLAYPFNIFLINLFTSPTFLLAAVLTLFLIMEIKNYLANGERQHLLISLLLVAGVSGAKGSFFPVIFCGLLLVWLYRLVSKHDFQRLNLLLTSSLLIFAAVFVYIFEGMGSEGLNILPFEVVHYTRLFAAYQDLGGNDRSLWFMLGLLPIYFISFYSFRAFALINLIKKTVTSLPRLTFERLFMVGLIVASFIPGYLLSYRGRSEYFYLFVGYIGLNLISAGYLYDVYTNYRSKWLKVILSILLLLSGTDTVISARQLPQMIPELQATSYQPLTPAIYEGLSYLRENTDRDAIIASHRSYIYFEDNPQFFYYSAFSERRMVVEGWKYMSRPYQQEAQRRDADMATLYTTRDTDIAASILDKYAIDYLIVEKQLKEQLGFDTYKLMTLGFQNSEMEIYQVNP